LYGWMFPQVLRRIESGTRNYNIMTEISPEGPGYISTPGIHSAEQIEGWKCVTKAVYVAGSHIVLQFWHVGRISHPPARRRSARRAVGHQAQATSFHGKGL
jgi:2,4-dienoyl-CoA reductase-like NADH-dependent reductase (Old Yellow Enzyme family)